MKNYQINFALIITSALAVTSLISINNAFSESSCCSSDTKQFAPVSVMGAHLHREGEWMLGYGYMYGAMSQGSSSSAGHSGSTHEDEHHMGIVSSRHEGHDHGDEDASDEHDEPQQPTSSGGHQHTMQHEMHMLEAMYGVSDDFNLMAMVPIINQRMNHRMPNEGFSTDNNGIGDVSLTAMHSLYRGERSLIHANLGMSFPTADINDKDVYHGVTTNHPYMMQIGSGTYDLLPAVTYQDSKGDLGWGTQAAFVFRLGRNSNDYSFGDRYQLSSWLGYQMSPGFRLTSRLTGKIWDDVSGSDDKLLLTSQMANPRSQAGRILEAGVGALYAFQDRVLDGHSVGVEVSFPIAQTVDAGFMEQDWSLNAAWRVAF
jgi:hypothetical protein